MKQEAYVISEKRRAVWAEELELFEVLREICERHDIRFFADSGTLIGAVRHGGFIPWDDDMDFSMLREDYDRFIEYAKEELKAPYHLQIPSPGDDYFYGHAKIRKDNTTAIRYVQYPEKYRHHQGVFIDVFPLDNIPDGKAEHKVHKFIALKLLMFITYSKYYYQLSEHPRSARIKHKLGRILLPTDKALYRCSNFYTRWIKQPDKKRTARVGYTSMYYYLEDQGSFKREWFDTSVELPFEDRTIPVPAEYDKVLTQWYGDYMIPVEAPSEHGDVFFDLEHDYREYYNGTRTFTFEDCGL